MNKMAKAFEDFINTEGHGTSLILQPFSDQELKAFRQCLEYAMDNVHDYMRDVRKIKMTKFNFSADEDPEVTPVKPPSLPESDGYGARD